MPTCFAVQVYNSRRDYWMLRGMVNERETVPLVPVTTTELGPAGTGVKTCTRLPPQPLPVMSGAKAATINNIFHIFRRRRNRGISVSKPAGSSA